MTDNESTAPPEDALPTDSNETHAEDAGNAGREAAKYRRRLRDTETERDALRERVTAMQRGDVERIAAEHLKVPSGLWASAALEDLLDESGNIHPQKVQDAAEKAKADLGLAGPRDHLARGPYAPREGYTSPPPKRSDWSSAFGPSST